MEATSRQKAGRIGLFNTPDFLIPTERASVLNARAAVAMAPRVAALMASEFGRDAAWQAEQTRNFSEVARGYLLSA